MNAEATDAQKHLSQSEKVLNAILRAKLNYMKKFLSNEMNSFLQCRRQHFMSLSFFAEKVIFRAYVHNNTSLDLLRTPETDFHEFEFFAEKVILELKCTKTLL